MQGQIIKNISNDYTILDNNQNKYICKPRGIMKLNKVTPLVGDRVIFDEHKLVINEILPRKNELIRPSIANVDMAIIVTSVKNPNFDTVLLDKLLTIISFNNIEPIIYLSKLDLLNESEKKDIEKYIDYYQKIGYIVIQKASDIIPIIKDKIVVLTGQSGAGKSTLLNKLEPMLKLKTNEISLALGRGIHTTRYTELYNVKGAYIADTPGFSKIDFIGMNEIDIRDNMKEMFNNLEKCKYSDCMHVKEDGCHVIELVNNNKIIKSRYDNYRKFIGRWIMKVSTSILSAKDKILTTKELNSSITDYIHLDIMDNTFVENTSLPIEEVKKIQQITKKPLDIHLMISNPEPYINKIPNDYLLSITIHTEINQNIDNLIRIIKAKNCQVGLALNPDTNINKIEKYKNKIDKLIIMSVNPGYGGQPFIKNTIKRIKKIKDKYPNLIIEVDGGINDKTIKNIKNDIDIAVAGSYIINSSNYNEAINELKN